jgi:hypothetical protein
VTFSSSATSTTRLRPSGNHKYRPGPIVTVEYEAIDRPFRPRDFPAAQQSNVARSSTVPEPLTGRPTAALDRARRYVAAIPPAVAGNAGDAATFRVCCRLARGFALEDSDALSVLADWNRACVPPWSEEELRAKLNGARRYGREPVGGLLVGSLTQSRSD